MCGLKTAFKDETDCPTMTVSFLRGIKTKIENRENVCQQVGQQFSIMLSCVSLSYLGAAWQLYFSVLATVAPLHIYRF